MKLSPKNSKRYRTETKLVLSQGVKKALPSKKPKTLSEKILNLPYTTQNKF